MEELLEELFSVRSILSIIVRLVISLVIVSLILRPIWNRMPWMRRRQEAQAADRMTDIMKFS